MKTLAKETWQIAAQNWKNVLFYELLYRGITLPVYLRLINRALHMALRMAGYSYLTAGNIGDFLIRPATILIFLLVSIVCMLLVALEMAGLITAFQGAAYHQKLSPLHILWGGIQKLADEAAKKNWKLGVLALVTFFLTNLFLLGRAFTHVRPVNFVLQEICQEKAALLFLALLLLFCMAMAVPGMFVFHACMIEQRSFADAMTRSRGLLRKHLGRSVALVLGSNLVILILILVLYGLSVAVAAVLVVLFTEKNLALATMLFLTRRLEIILLFFGSILTVVVNYAALSVLFYQFGNRRFHEPRWDFKYPARGTAESRKLTLILCVIAFGGLFYLVDLARNGAGLSDAILVQTQITAHRGSSWSAPENTMAAVRAAEEELADCVELDVQMTADGIVVLGHDASLKRVAGVNRSIQSLTFEELQRLDVGSWFGAEFAGEPIPTLAEVLEFCKGKLDLNIEIKSVRRDSDLPHRVVELILEHGMEEQCVVTSTSLNYLKQVKELAPQLRTGYIVSAAYGDFYSNEAVDFISIRHSFVNERLIESVHEQGKAVHAWTVNVKSEIERLRLLGVDNIITDRPIFAREIIYREEATEDLIEYLRMMLE